MLLLKFRAGDNLYAVDARQVVEVVPNVGARKLPHAPVFLIGLLRYRGGVVPLVDFTRLAGAGTCKEVLSTRIVVTRFTDPGGATHRLGLLAESVDQVLHARPDDLVPGGLRLSETPYLGGLVRHDDELVQLVRPEDVLPRSLRDSLYGDAPGSVP